MGPVKRIGVPRPTVGRKAYVHTYYLHEYVFPEGCAYIMGPAVCLLMKTVFGTAYCSRTGVDGGRVASRIHMMTILEEGCHITFIYIVYCTTTTLAPIRREGLSLPDAASPPLLTTTDTASSSRRMYIHCQEQGGETGVYLRRTKRLHHTYLGLKSRGEPMLKKLSSP